MFLIASGDATTLQVVLLLVGSSGLAGAVVTLLKLKPDADTAAVSQAKGAAEALEIAQRSLRRDRDEWKARATDAERDLALARLELEKCQRAHGRRTKDH